MAKRAEKQKPNLVLGRVVDKHNRPLANLTVQAFQRDMRSEKLLGESVTDKCGKYKIRWLPGRLRGTGEKEVDVAIKVLTRKKKILVYESDMDAVRFKASKREEINIAVETAILPEVVEYDDILKCVKYLAGKVAITDLQESEEHRDITFLSREAGIAAEKIEHLVVAHRLKDESKIDAAFFYALLRKNTLLKNDLVRSFHARLVIDIHADIQVLLYDTALVDPKVIRRDLEAAAKESIVSAKIAGEWKRHAESLRQYKKKAEEYYKNEHPRKVWNIISRFVLENKTGQMAKIFAENKNDMNAFLKKITDESFFKSDEKAAEAKASVALVGLLGFEETIISQVKEFQKINKPEDVKKLAALNKAGWKELLTKASGKMSIAGKPMDKKSIDLHASSLVRKMEKEYPTVAFSAQLSREKKTIFKNQDAIKDFFTKHDDFNLQHSNIDLFFKEKKLVADKNQAMREELKSVQRIFKLVPHYSKTIALRNQKIDSAQSISAIGEIRFVKEIAPQAGIKTREAREIFRKAERTSTAAMLIFGELQDTLRAMNIPALETRSLPMKLEAVSKDFPNLKSLFKLTDVCACEHCRSVYSPAAYLVEILRFLDNRSVVDLSVPAPIPPAVRPSVKIAKDVLFKRRPDLGEIDLSCENANTPVPYIDLVCECLEEAVAPDAGMDYTGNLSDGADPLKGKISAPLLTALAAAGMPVTDQAQVFETQTSDGSSATLPHYLRDKKAVCKIINTGGNNYKVFRLRQTLSPAEELAAAPEYVNLKAYEELKKANYAFRLPFDLNHAESEAYFSRFGISRAELMEDFQSAGNPGDETIAAEKLGLTDAERKLMITPKAALVDQQSYWHAPSQWDTPPVFGNVLDYMKRVDHFLDRTGLAYKELDLLLSLKFIDPDDELFIRHFDLSCDTVKKEITNLDEAALDRIHRFLRLQKKTGWKLELLDEIISQNKLGKGKLDDACLIQAADLMKLSRETGIKIEELIGFYGEIPHKELREDGPVPLYQQIFMNKAKNGFIDEGLLAEKVDGSQSLTTFKTSISVCLQIKEQDLDKLLPLLPDGKLTFSNLSYLFAGSRLMKKLKLKAEDFITLIQLKGTNFQDSPQATLDFVDAVKIAQKSPLKTADIRFMLHHEATDLADREIKDDKIKQILEKLQKDCQNNFTANKSPFDTNLTAEEQKETLQNALSKLSGIGEEDVKTFIKFIDRNWTSANDAKTFTEDKLGYINKDENIVREHFDTALIKNRIDALAAAPGPDIGIEQKDLVKAFLDAIAAYQLRIGKQFILEQTISSAFKADSGVVKIVLKYAKLKQPAPGNSLLSDILFSDDLIDTNVNHVEPQLPTIDGAAFPDQYRALRLLHKLLPLINAFKLSNQEMEWFFKNNKGLGWFEWDGIPYESGQTAIDSARYAAFAEMIDLSKQLMPVPNPADAEHPITFFSVAEMFLPGSAATRPDFIEKYSLLTGYIKEDVDAVDARLFAAWDITNYRKAETWKRIVKGVEHLRKLGSTVTQVEEFIKPVLTDSDAKTLRTALKARYDEGTWLCTLKEIMDAIRPQKRNTLVAFLLATNPEMKDENDLYDYFLVDVQMEACMPSSRIVQAHGTIQLFVQRCLMGLEPGAAADVNNDKSWEQWKWMKNYRVWEANRKVFLYPENWIEAELRDNKSYLFSELENELLQNELTEFTAQEALIKYLEKLDGIAFLEVVAAWYQSDIKTMHVFARTKGGDPAIYYYRRFEWERYWTPWEKVELDITGDHLLAFVRNNRLCLAWPVFSEEPNPDQGVVLPDQTRIDEQPVNKPRKKLKIQLAISEFADKKWQPKKISKDGITTPENYSCDDLDFERKRYSLIYFESADQIWLISSSWGDYLECHSLNGVFTIAGCKGYPELIFQGRKYMNDFFPDFEESELRCNRYFDIDGEVLRQSPHLAYLLNDKLSIRNALTFFQFRELLKKTPDPFRISYPHQVTVIDFIALLLEYLWMLVYAEKVREWSIKAPLGTLLPYFMEDSNHAYVIVPGFYGNERKKDKEDMIVASRTVSNVMQLIEDIIALFKKYIAKYMADPGQDIHALVHELITDAEFQEIKNELKVYEGLDLFYEFMEKLNKNVEIDEVLEEIKNCSGLIYGEQFKNMYHPLVCALRKTLYKDGIPELMKRDTQLMKTDFNFESHYSPNAVIVPKTYLLNENGAETLSHPVEDLDFSSDGSYSGYNWELFFHVPFLLATRLTKNQRFEEALIWFHYMFNPTGALEGTAPQKYWVTKPFYLTQDDNYVSQRIDTLLYKIADPTTPERAELEFAIEQWRTKPFRPHVVARFRPVAYQKALLMKYIDNLTEWGDYLFRQDTMESIVQATQMYILADKLLGPKPRIIPPAVIPPYETYNQMEARLDAFGNALIDLENILPDLSALPEGGAELPPPPVTLSMLYFCIPQNDKMLEYWDRIADRLFKIRHCQNIDGVERSLALFAPPIDPGMLVRAAAAGLDISSILAGINAPAPYYRFHVLSQKATELAQEVRGLGSSLLQALEKKDAEVMSLLRSELEIKVLNAVKDIKLLQIKEAKEQIEILKRTKAVTEERNKYYSNINKIIPKEQLNLDKLEQAHGFQLAAQIIQTLGGMLSLLPEAIIGAAGFGGSPHATVKWGGFNLANAAKSAADVLNIFSSIASYEASRASILGGYERRFDDWKLQERLAKKELAQIDKQIVAAEIRKEISETDLKNHELQIENAKKTDEFMRSKFTNKELYDWMIGQISSVYFRAYQLAHDFAKKAERSYRFELGNDDSFIQYGYWDTMKKGLQSADQLIHDIKRMETSYLDKNKREYEMTKHVSLSLLDPLSLVRLRATGVCDFEVPEVLYDMDHPGHYFRRIKSVSISLPCIAGPYTSMSAKLSLVSNRYRKSTNPDNLAATGYPEDPGNDERFVYNVGAIQSIAASNAQNDSGLFELNFRDERYLPFEGCGAIGSWRLELPEDARQFDYNTISDVILHVKYTAREGGSSLKSLAVSSLKDRLDAIRQQLGQTGLHLAIHMKHDLPNEWHLFKKNGSVDLKIDQSRLPYMAQTIAAAIENVMFLARIKSNPATFSINIDENATDLARIDEWKLCRGNNADIELNTPFTLSVAPEQLNNLEELMMVVKYSF